MSKVLPMVQRLLPVAVAVELASPDLDLANLGNRIKIMRIAAGLPQRALGEATATTTAYISRIEAGERRPSAKVLNGIATVLDASPAQVLGLVDWEAAPPDPIHTRLRRLLREVRGEEDSALRWSLEKMVIREASLIMQRISDL